MAIEIDNLTIPETVRTEISSEGSLVLTPDNAKPSIPVTKPERRDQPLFPDDLPITKPLITEPATTPITPVKEPVPVR